MTFKTNDRGHGHIPGNMTMFATNVHIRASLTEPENRRTEKGEFSLPKTCFQFRKALAQNRARKPKLKNRMPARTEPVKSGFFTETPTTITYKK